MRIVHVIDELKTGGAQTHLATILVEAVKRYNFEHTVISLFGAGQVGERLEQEGFRVVVLDLRPYFSKRDWIGAVRLLQQLFEELQPDLVEAHLTWSRLLGLLAARRAGVTRRIGFEQGDIYFNSFKFRVANYFSQLYIDDYIVCSQALAEWVRQTHRISHRKLHVFHNCVDPDRFHPDIPPAKDIQSWHEAKRTVFSMVGTLGRGVNKRVDLGIRAVAQARRHGHDVGLVIAGDGEQRQELEQLATDLGVAAYVRFLGMRQDIPQILRATDVFCHAAPFEPFGIVALEAMATGLPVIVPNAGGIQEAVAHGQTGLVYPVLDDRELADQMIRLHLSKEMRQAMGIAARKVVEERFTTVIYLDRLYRLYGLIA